MRALVIPIVLALSGCAGDGDCYAGSVDVGCDADGCFCLSGPHDGEACDGSEDVDRDDPDNCENVCATCEDAGGPTSVLLGT